MNKHLQLGLAAVWFGALGFWAGQSTNTEEEPEQPENTIHNVQHTGLFTINTCTEDHATVKVDTAVIIPVRYVVSGLGADRNMEIEENMVTQSLSIAANQVDQLLNMQSFSDIGGNADFTNTQLNSAFARASTLMKDNANFAFNAPFTPQLEATKIEEGEGANRCSMSWTFRPI